MCKVVVHSGVRIRASTCAGSSDLQQLASAMAAVQAHHPQPASVHAAGLSSTSEQHTRKQAQTRSHAGADTNHVQSQQLKQVRVLATTRAFRFFDSSFLCEGHTRVPLISKRGGLSLKFITRHSFCISSSTTISPPIICTGFLREIGERIPEFQERMFELCFCSLSLEAKRQFS